MARPLSRLTASLLAALAVPPALAVLAWPRAARAHGGTPRIVQISFPRQLDGGLWAVTDNQGLYASAGGSTRWLCEDAVAPNAGFQQAVLVGPDTSTWLVATNLGLYRSENGGCDFEPVSGPLATHVPAGLWPDPEHPEDVLTATQSANTTNDVFRTRDGGRTWTAAGLSYAGITHGLVRSPVDAARVYVAHADGAARSDDGGRTFTPLALGPEALDVLPEEFRLLAAHPTRRDEVWATVERFPDSTVIRSQDAGATWAPMFTLADTPGGLVFDRDGGRALVVSRFDEYRRSEDGGETWTREAEAVPLLGCLTMEPGSDRLWGCSNVFFMGPWVLGRSDDFGRTWQPALARFTDVRAQWGCLGDSDSTLACEGLCPGLAAGAVCDLSGVDAGAQGADAAPGQADGGAGQADASSPPDGGRRVDAGAVSPDAEVVAAADVDGGQGGCGVARGASRSGWLLALGLAGILGRGRHRRRARA